MGYTFYNEARKVYTYIDHFFVSCNMFDTVENVCVIEDAENFSDHHPITVCFGLPTAAVGDVPCIDVSGEIEDVQTIRKVVWLEEVKQEYASAIDAA